MYNIKYVINKGVDKMRDYQLIRFMQQSATGYCRQEGYV